MMPLSPYYQQHDNISTTTYRARVCHPHGNCCQARLKENLRHPVHQRTPVSVLYGYIVKPKLFQVSSFINTLSTYTCDMRYKTRKKTKYKGWVVWNSTSSNIIICQLATKKRRKKDIK